MHHRVACVRQSSQAVVAHNVEQPRCLIDGVERRRVEQRWTRKGRRKKARIHLQPMHRANMAKRGEVTSRSPAAFAWPPAMRRLYSLQMASKDASLIK